MGIRSTLRIRLEQRSSPDEQSSSKSSPNLTERWILAGSKRRTPPDGQHGILLCFSGFTTSSLFSLSCADIKY